jgi:pimeloyl-ACP methyl ester carboxylesterase
MDTPIPGLRFVLACAAVSLTLAVAGAPSVYAQSTCDPDGLQASGSIYRICMPPPETFNGSLVIFAHGFQDAGTPVQIPEEQLEAGGLSLPGLVNDLGFAFATNSYSKTGLAVRQGMDDILDLVDIYTQTYGPPDKVFLTGASEGGIVTALLVEQHPEVFAGGVAACGPIGNFRGQINYFGNGRVLFDWYFPGLIPGDPLDPPDDLVDNWETFYATVVEPEVFAPSNAATLMEYAAVAKLPFDPADPIESLKISVRDMLRYGVVNFRDAGETLGGFPFGNRWRWYTGSSDDAALNAAVARARADPAALAEMRKHYTTSGRLEVPLITVHTTLDQQVPFWHETLYAVKTLLSGALFKRHLPIVVNRFEHCNFTAADVLVSFGAMLLYSGDLGLLSGVGSVLAGDELTKFETLAKQQGLPYRLQGERLKLIPPPGR